MSPLDINPGRSPGPPNKFPSWPLFDERLLPRLLKEDELLNPPPSGPEFPNPGKLGLEELELNADDPIPNELKGS